MSFGVCVRIYACVGVRARVPVCVRAHVVSGCVWVHVLLCVRVPMLMSVVYRDAYVLVLGVSVCRRACQYVCLCSAVSVTCDVCLCMCVLVFMPHRACVRVCVRACVGVCVHMCLFLEDRVVCLCLCLERRGMQRLTGRDISSKLPIRFNPRTCVRSRFHCMFLFAVWFSWGCPVHPIP